MDKNITVFIDQNPVNGQPRILSVYDGILTAFQLGILTGMGGDPFVETQMHFVGWTPQQIAEGAPGAGQYVLDNEIVHVPNNTTDLFERIISEHPVLSVVAAKMASGDKEGARAELGKLGLTAESIQNMTDAEMLKAMGVEKYFSADCIASLGDRKTTSSK